MITAGKPSPTSVDSEFWIPNWHHLPNWEILPELVVKPDTAPSHPLWAKKISQMGETIYIILHQIPLNEPNNEWKTGNCIWKVLIGSKMWSKFTEHPIKAFAINLQAQVLIRTIPCKLRLVTEAKWAAEGEHKNWRNEHHHLLKGLPASKSATKQHLKRKVWKEYERGFRKSLRYERATRIDPKVPTSNFVKIAAKLTRQQASILVQLHTGHVPLQAYLYHFKLAKTATCPSCGIEPKTVTHFILHCMSYVAQRHWLRCTLGRDQSLGLEILGDAKNIKVFMNYVHSTKHFEESHGDLHHAGQEDE